MPAQLEIRHYTGDVQRHRLAKDQPVSIGRHQTNDICVDDDDVELLHCRITWNKKQRQYEVVAAGTEGVDVNGRAVRQAFLQDGDSVRVGTVEIVLETGGQAAAPVPAGRTQGSSEIGLEPITDSEVSANSDSEDEPPPEPPNPKESAEAGRSRTDPDSKRRQGTDRKADGSLSDDLYEALAEGDALDDDSGDDGSEADGGEPGEEDLVLHRGGSGQSAARDRQQDSLARQAEELRQRLRPQPARPGEQDLLRSPVVLSLIGGAFVLLIASATIWFIIQRQRIQTHYDSAMTAMEQGKYQQAVQLFRDFLKEHPQHDYADPVRFALEKSEIEKEISGATPAWSTGLEELQDFIRKFRDHPDFSEHRASLRQYAESIALGAAKTAGDAKDRSLLTVSEEATKLLLRFSPPDDPPVKLQNQIEQARLDSQDAILKHETFNKAVAAVEEALERKTPMAALKARRDLLTRYPDFESNPRMNDLLDRTLETERNLIAEEERDRGGVTAERDAGVPQPLSLALHSRTRTDETSDGRTVFATAKGCCYGIDMVTGRPLWRRVIGLDPPFFPQPVSTSVPGVLVFDTNHRELVLVRRRTGELVWRQPIGEDIGGPPLIHEGQIYLATSGRHLYKIDLATGRISTRLRFSQKILAPPVLIGDGDSLVVAGHEGVVYTVSLRPLACRSVSFIGHEAGAVDAPLVKMGALVLLAENDRTGSSRLRVLDVRNPESRLEQVASVRVDGQVRDRPVLRGKQLFVPSSPERITAFTVSDDPNQRALTLRAEHRVPTSHPGALYLEAGPDGQLWMAGSALRRFQLTTDSIKPDPDETAAGLTSQPLQMIGRNLFVGRRMPYSGAVVFTQVDREEMVSHWRAVVGAEVLGRLIAPDESLVSVTEQGHIFRTSPGQLDSGGFQTRLAGQLDVPEDLQSPLRSARLGNGRLAIAAGAPEPRLWVVNRVGQVQRRVELDAPLQADPVPLADGLVAPLPGRLRFIGATSSGRSAEDYVAPMDEEQEDARWVHLAAVDEQHVLALDSLGRLAKIQFRTAPVPNLAAVTTVQLETAVDVPFVVHDGKLVLADAARGLRMLETATMEPLDDIELEHPASHALWSVGDRLYVEVGGTRLRCYELGSELKPLWRIPLEGTRLAGPPTPVREVVVLTLQNGAVWAVDPAAEANPEGGRPKTAPVRRRLNVGHALNGAALQLGDRLVVSSIDGSLYRIESVVNEVQATARK